MDSETIYSVIGVVMFGVLAFYTLKNDEIEKIQTKEEKVHEIVNGYRKELRESLRALEDDKEAQKMKRLELLKKFNSELSRNIFFDDFEIKEIIEELSSLTV